MDILLDDLTLGIEIYSRSRKYLLLHLTWNCVCLCPIIELKRQFYTNCNLKRKEIVKFCTFILHKDHSTDSKVNDLVTLIVSYRSTTISLLFIIGIC